MKAAVFYGAGDIRVEERPMPKAGPGQMVVKIDYCGVCGTDMEAYKHEIVKPVIVLGHENVGTVYEVGEGVTKFKVGDKVLCGPPSYCAEGCSSCKSGKPNICAYGFPRTNGIGGPDGGFAEYMLVGDVDHTMIIPVPEGVDIKDAVLFDVICVSLHAIRKSNFKFGDNVVISGGGPIGEIVRYAYVTGLQATSPPRMLRVYATSSSASMMIASARLTRKNALIADILLTALSPAIFIS